MSIWREIWKESVAANRIMAENEEDGLIAFHKLFQDYGDDGMIHYAKGQSYEYRKNRQKALEEYSKAKDLFPVEHWKEVAENTIQRVQKNKTTEAFFDENDFSQLLWLAFQKIWEYVRLDDFARYVALSALARGSSEWPLTLIDFRTVMEILIKNNYPEIVEYVKSQNNDEFLLYKSIEELKKQQEIHKNICVAMHQIRKAGNNAVHKMEISDYDKFENIQAFLQVLDFFSTLERPSHFRYN